MSLALADIPFIREGSVSTLDVKKKLASPWRYMDSSTVLATGQALCKALRWLMHLILTMPYEEGP